MYLYSPYGEYVKKEKKEIQNFDFEIHDFFQVQFCEHIYSWNKK